MQVRRSIMIEKKYKPAELIRQYGCRLDVKFSIGDAGGCGTGCVWECVVFSLRTWCGGMLV